MGVRRTYLAGPQIYRASWHRKLPKLFHRHARSLSGRFASVPEEIITHSAEETIHWGRKFSRGLKPPALILLTVDLATGNTTLTKGIVSGLVAATEDDITSPTCTLGHVY